MVQLSHKVTSPYGATNTVGALPTTRCNRGAWAMALDNPTIAASRFWSKVQQTSTCWLWTASLRHKGYGAFVWSEDGRRIQGRAHRFSWMLHYGTIPPSLSVLHHCDTPACVRPDHLWLGTKAQNNADMVTKGRHVPGGTYATGKYKRGTEHHNARLTPTQVDEIRDTYATGTISFSKLGKRYGITWSHAWRIVRGHAWKQHI
jgi:hypothetical protein